MKVELSKENLKKSLISGLGGGLAILLISIFGIILKNPILIAPFGASCVLIFGLHDSPLAKSKNLIGSHLISSLIRLVMLYFFGKSYLVISVAASWKFLYINIILGLIILVIATFIYNKVRKISI